MADRVVKVTLRAQIAEYKQGMLDAAASTRTVGTEAEKLAQKKQAFQQVGGAALAMGVSVGAGVMMVVSKFADFDQAMSNVAATGQDARDNIDALREAAIDAGAATVFSAEESANAIEEMAKAGIDAKDVLGGGLTGALDLAAAGGLGVADAAGIAATALKIFNLEGSDMSHVADLLAAGAGKAMGDVTDLSQALAQGGQVAAATGLSIEETTATLAAFASQGLLGSDAGTSFKTMLQRLTPQSAEAKKKMDDLGIAAYDAAGEFVGMEKFAGNLRTALADLTPEQRNAALSVMFGSDAVRAANVLYKEGESGIRDWIAAVDDQGYAAETAATRLDNIKGDWEALTGAVDSALIGMGEAADGPLRFFVQSMTGVVDVFNDLPAGAQQAVFWTGAAASAALIAGGVYLLAVPKIAEYNAAVATLGPTAQRTAGLVGKSMKVLSGAAAAAAALAVLPPVVDAITESLFKYSDVSRNLTAENRSLSVSFDALVHNGKSWADVAKNAPDVLDRLGDLDQFFVYIGALDDTGQAAVGLANALQELSPAIAALPLERGVAMFRDYAGELGATRPQMLNMLENMDEFKAKLIAEAQAQGIAATDANLLALALGEVEGASAGATGATDKNRAALEDLQGVAVDTATDVNELADAIRDFGSAQFDTERATIKFYQAFDDLNAQLADGAGSLDVTTEAGQNTLSALLDAAQATNDYAAAVAAMGGSTEEVQGILDSGRQKIFDTRVALGEGEDAARRWADQLIATPETIATQVKLNGIEAAANGMRELIRTYDGRQITMHLGLNQVVVGDRVYGGLRSDSNAAGGMYASGVKEFAAGGFEPGIYPHVPGGIHKFAEAGDEAYISFLPQYRDRNIGILQESARRLGVEAAAPAPRSEAPIVIRVVETIHMDVDGRELARTVRDYEREIR